MGTEFEYSPGRERRKQTEVIFASEVFCKTRSGVCAEPPLGWEIRNALLNFIHFHTDPRRAAVEWLLHSFTCAEHHGRL